jgi:hypothetical protein
MAINYGSKKFCNIDTWKKSSAGSADIPSPLVEWSVAETKMKMATIFILKSEK